jgi:hypothetical protein
LFGVVAPEVSGVESTTVVLHVDLRSWNIEKPGSLKKRGELICSL